MAEPMLVYQDEALRVYWNEERRYFLSEWQGVFRKGAALRRSYQRCVEAAKARRPSVWLTDARKFPVLDPVDAKWIVDWFWPEFVRAGAVYQAAVAPLKQVGKMSAGRATEKLAESGSIALSVHETIADAEAAIAAWHAKHAND